MIHEGIPKIADFGAGKRIGVKTNHKNGSMGAICYLDPRRYMNPNYELRGPSDIYSLGVNLWQLSSGKRPFNKESRCMDLFKQISQGRREIDIEGTPNRFAKLYQACWHSGPANRPNIIQVCKELNEIENEKNNIPRFEGIHIDKAPEYPSDLDRRQNARQGIVNGHGG